MIRSALGKVAWVGRTASMVFGLALVMALVLGVAGMAFGANGDFFKLGKKNVASAVSRLVKQGPGPALKLQVGAGQPPLAVNSAGKVANLNADQVDGQSFSCPSGTLLHEGVCIDAAKRPAQARQANAEQDCLDEGKRLPTVAELQTFRIRGGHDFTGQFVNEWTSARDFWGETWGASVVYTDGTVGWANLSNFNSYRCVAFPS